MTTETDLSLTSSNEESTSLRTSFDYVNVKKAALILRAANNKFRQQLLKLIREKARMTVTEVYITLKCEQSVASQHLAILRKVGIVKTKREGKYIHYSLNQDRIYEMNKFIYDLLKINL